MRMETKTQASRGEVQVGILYGPRLKWGFDLNVRIDSEPKSRKTQTLEPTTGVFLWRITFSPRIYNPAGRVERAERHRLSE
jgi:hypothetical protein